MCREHGLHSGSKEGGPMWGPALRRCDLDRSLSSLQSGMHPPTNTHTTTTTLPRLHLRASEEVAQKRFPAPFLPIPSSRPPMMSPCTHQYKGAYAVALFKVVATPNFTHNSTCVGRVRIAILKHEDCHLKYRIGIHMQKLLNGVFLFSLFLWVNM